MNAFLEMSAEQQRDLCQQAGAQMGIEAASVEKDFWVCWILRELFALPEHGSHFTFKGGTSLSKSRKLIERFSEDIDLVIDRSALGLEGEASPETATGSNERNRRLEALMIACRERVTGPIREALEAMLRKTIPAGYEWSVVEDDEDADHQTLLFRYLSQFAGAEYVKPIVRLEFGARSDIDPTETPEIQPYISEILPGLIGNAVFPVRTVAPVRTFWEKSMLLHEEVLKVTEPKLRLARHYYDLWSLIRHGIAASAAGDLDLFRRIAAHRAIYFRKNRKTIESLKPGTLQMLPAEMYLSAWRRDYDAMRGPMMFGETPTFDAILAVVGEFQERFNAAHVPAT